MGCTLRCLETESLIVEGTQMNICKLQLKRLGEKDQFALQLQVHLDLTKIITVVNCEDSVGLHRAENIVNRTISSPAPGPLGSCSSIK